MCVCVRVHVHVRARSCMCVQWVATGGCFNFYCYHPTFTQCIWHTIQAEKVKASLAAAGLSVWMDPHTRVEKTFMRHSGWFIPTAKVIIPLLSPNFASSSLCLQELALAQVLDKRTVPVSLVPFEQLRLDFDTVLIVSQLEIEFLTSFAMYEATMEAVESTVRAAMAAIVANGAAAAAAAVAASTAATNYAAADVDTRKEWNLPAVPAHQRLPFWTTAFGHVETVEWEIFVSSLFMNLPILNSVQVTTSPNPLRF